MTYVLIFAVGYAFAFVVINMRISSQRAKIKESLKNFGASVQRFDEDLRAAMPLSKELLIRIWAPLVYSVVPAGLISLGYFALS